MKIKIINPNTCLDMTKSIEMVANEYAHANTNIVAVSPKRGPISIESYYDEALATIGVMEEIVTSQTEMFDGYIIACFGDPGLSQAREITDTPVVGIAEASMFMACMLGSRFSILSTVKRFEIPMLELIKKYGLESRCASVRYTDMPVIEFEQNKKKGEQNLLEIAYKAVNEDNAEVLCLGCAGMVGFDKILEKKIGVPVIDPVAAAVKALEGIIGCRKKTSKVNTFKKLRSKEIIGFSPLLTHKVFEF